MKILFPFPVFSTASESNLKSEPKTPRQNWFYLYIWVIASASNLSQSFIYVLYIRASRYAVFGSRKKTCSSKPHFVRSISMYRRGFFFKKQCIFKAFVKNPRFVRLHLCSKGDFFFLKTVCLQGFCSKSAHLKVTVM